MSSREISLLTALIVAIAALLFFQHNQMFRSAFAMVSERFQPRIDVNRPAKMLEGYNQARRVFIDERVIHQPVNWTWNYLPKKPTEALGNWLVYGDVRDPGEQFYLGVQFEGDTPLNYLGVRSSTLNRQLFLQHEIKPHFIGGDREIITSLGAMNVATFSYDYQGISKLCIGFVSESSETRFQGFYCPEGEFSPSLHRFKCILSAIRVYDDAYWRDPKLDPSVREECVRGSGSGVSA